MTAFVLLKALCMFVVNMKHETASYVVMLEKCPYMAKIMHTDTHVHCTLTSRGHDHENQLNNVHLTPPPLNKLHATKLEKCPYMAHF